MLQKIPELILEVRANLRCVTIEQAMQEIANKGGLLLDVRETAEVEAQPTPLSTHIPRGVVEMKLSAQLSDSEHPIYVHCASGARASLAAEQLRRIGYQQVNVVTCAIDEICKLQAK